MAVYSRIALLALAALLAFQLLPPRVAMAQATEEEKADQPQPPSIFTGEKISIEFQNTDIRRVITLIGEVSGKNIVVSDGVSGRVTLKLVDMPWDEALDVVLASQNLALEESDNVLIIYDQATLQRVQANRPKSTAGERLVK